MQQALRLFESGAFSKGLEILNQARFKDRESPERVAPVLAALALFHERYADDVGEATRYLEELLGLGLPPGHPAPGRAREALAKIEAQAKRYRVENEMLLGISVEQYEPEIFEKRVKELRSLVERRPDYPHLASVYYYLGKHLLLLGRHREAHRALVRALELRPALSFHLPVEAHKAQAFRHLLRHDLTWAVRVALAVIGLFWIPLFYRSRPWRRLGLRHGILLLSLVALWWVFFRVSVWVAGQTVLFATGELAQPVYVHTSPGSPMSEMLDALFACGLVGILSAFVIVVSTAHFRYRWIWAAVNAVVTLVLLSSLMAVFYLRHGDLGFWQAEGSRNPYLGGVFFSISQEQEPFILTAPRSYCGFLKNLDEMDEEEVKAWFRRFEKVCSR